MQTTFYYNTIIFLFAKSEIFKSIFEQLPMFIYVARSSEEWRKSEEVTSLSVLTERYLNKFKAISNNSNYVKILQFNLK